MTTRSIKSGVYPQNLTDVAGELFFTNANADPGALWKSNGSKAGTLFVSTQAQPSELTAVGDILYLLRQENDGWQYLVQTDGTAAHTYTLYGANTNNGAFMTNLTSVGGDVLMYTFTNYLWQVGGSINVGPVVPYDQNQTTSWLDTNLTDVGGTLFYAGLTSATSNNNELWAYTP